MPISIHKKQKTTELNQTILETYRKTQRALSEHIKNITFFLLGSTAIDHVHVISICECKTVHERKNQIQISQIIREIFSF